MKSKDDHVNQLADDVRRYQARVSELERQLADLAKGKSPEWEQLDPDMLMIESITSSKGFRPRVVLRWFTHYAQLDEQAARQLAFQILEACEASLADSFIASFMKNKIGADNNAVGQMMMEFRAHRERIAEESKRENPNPTASPKG